MPIVRPTCPVCVGYMTSGSEAVNMVCPNCGTAESDWPAVVEREMCADMSEGSAGISLPDIEESLAMQEWLQ